MKRILLTGFIAGCVVIGLALRTEATGRTYRITIIMDTIDDWSSEMRDGFKLRLDELLAQQGAQAEYTEYDTELKEDKAATILQALQQSPPDLICTLNYPSGFADLQIARKLTDPTYRFVSENAVALQAGVIESWERPGGNLTGVGVFLQFNSPLRLMKWINPQAKKLIFYTWDAMTLLNDWFEDEMTRACQEEGLELVEFARVPHAEAQFEFMARYANAGREYFAMGGISAYVHADGTFADMNVLETAFIKETMQIPAIWYEETPIRKGAGLAATSVIWTDLGAQLAEKGLRILNGENPGEIPWEYPRKYNIILNLQAAKKLGIEFPPEVISAAYRVYTDGDGHYVGQ